MAGSKDSRFVKTATETQSHEECESDEAFRLVMFLSVSAPLWQLNLS